MRELFADTFHFAALLNPRDEAHEIAAEFAQQSDRRIVTTTWVLTELADGLAGTKARPLFGRLLSHIRSDPRATVAEATESLFERAVDLYNSRPDKEWSLTDCVSFVTMQDHDLTEALTGDHHFEQAGFTAILKQGRQGGS